LIDRYEEESINKEVTLLDQISKSIANVYDNDAMRSKIRAQLLKFEHERKATLIEGFKMKKKLTE